MKTITVLGTFSSVGALVDACASGLHALHMQRTFQHGYTEAALRKRQAEQITLPSLNYSLPHWTVDQNLREMQVTDDAFNAHDLARINHAEDMTVYLSGGVTMNLEEHLTDIQLTFSVVPDAAPHNHHYQLQFGEGDWTVVIAKITGTNDGPLPGLDGTLLPPTHLPIYYDLMTICRWRNGRMEEEYLWVDAVTQYRQLQLLPDVPPMYVPDLVLNNMTNPTTRTPGVDNAAGNKLNVERANEAVNNGSTDASSLLLSPNMTVYGLSDQPIGLDEYINWLRDTRSAFPDLKYTLNQTIAQGDWTATIGMMSGTHMGDWILPAYLANAPIPATGKKFSLLHYFITRWENGMVAEMRVNGDPIGIMTALGVELMSPL